MATDIWGKSCCGSFTEKSKNNPTKKWPRYLGCYGIGARILYSRMKAGVDRWPENMTRLSTGPLTGTGVLATRYMVVAKSPLTGGLGDANPAAISVRYLKFSGFDAVFSPGISQTGLFTD